VNYVHSVRERKWEALSDVKEVTLAYQQDRQHKKNGAALALPKKGDVQIAGGQKKKRGSPLRRQKRGDKAGTEDHPGSLLRRYTRTRRHRGEEPRTKDVIDNAAGRGDRKGTDAN